MADVYALRRKNVKQARYRWNHKKLRAALVPLVQTGTVRCARGAECRYADGDQGGFIHPGEAWDLGHDDLYPHLHSGPEHVVCNRGAPNRLKFSREW